MAAAVPFIPELTLEHCARALRVLAHVDRLRIVEALDLAEHSVGELADALSLSQPAVSQHLTLMRAHGLLDCEKHGRLCYYRVTNPHALNVLRCIRKHGQGA